MTKSKTSLLLAFIAGGILAVGQAGLATAGVDISVCPGCTLKTVADGMNAASAGDRVVVGTVGRDTPETYENTNIEMKKGVTLISEGDNSPAEEEYSDPYGKVTETFPVLKRTTLTILQGAGEAAVVSFPAVDNATLDGFIIENVDATAPSLTGLVMVRDGSSLIIQNNIIRDNQRLGLAGGIMVSGSSETITPLIQNNIIHRVNGPGIALNANTYPTIEANIIYTTPPAGSGAISPGIGLRDTASAKIIGNEIFESSKAGIGSKEFGLTDSGNELIIKGNTIRDNSKGGIRIQGQADNPTTGVNVTIGGPNEDDTNIFENNLAAIYTKSDGDHLGTITIENNEFSWNEAAGNLEDLTKVTIKDNISYVCMGHACWRLNDIDTIVIQREDISYSTRAGIHILGNKPMDLLIENNTIANSPQKGCIFLQNTEITGTVTGNDLSGCKLGGLQIGTPMTLNIFDNEIHDNMRGGIHTGSGYSAEPLEFNGDPADLHLTVRGNKVYHNGQDGYGGGIDLRHASGVIENNLIYKNNRAGIRFGDYITSIQHNTVVYNGVVLDDDGVVISGSGFGSGIVYDDYLIGDELDYDPPSGSPSPSDETPLPSIRNNILVGNEKAGINAGTLASSGTTCGDWDDERVYNLFSANNSMTDSCDGAGPACIKRQLALCTQNTGEIFAAPLFGDAVNNDYSLNVGSPALDSGESGVDMGAYGGSDPMDW